VLARVASRGVWLKFCTHETLKRSANAHGGLGRVRAELAAATTFQATQSFSGAMIGSAALRKSEDSANATTSRARSRRPTGMRSRNFQLLTFLPHDGPRD